MSIQKFPDDWEINENKSRLESGKRYKICLNDCCIQGTIYGMFIRWDTSEIGEGIAVFDIGTIGPEWGEWEPVQVFSEIEDVRNET